VTDDRRLAERIARLRNGGLVAHGLHAERGITSRLDELQAAILRIRLPGLAAANAARRRHAEGYDRELRGVARPAVRPGCLPAPHQYVIRHPRRDALRAALAEAGFPLLVHYPRPIHLQGGFESPEHPPGSLPVAERLAAEVLSLPTHPYMTSEERALLAGHVSSAATRLQEAT
jgi:dTDP-4-amino-4,6-dideoxygalactose transaminase